jgi:hypothetical protein
MKILTAILFMLVDCFGVLMAQPGVCLVGQTTAGCPCSASQNPCIQAFLAGASASFGTMQTNIGPLPQPAIYVAAEIPPGNAAFRNQDTPGCQRAPATCIFSTAIPNTVSKGLNAYIDNVMGTAQVKGHGVNLLDYNFDPTYYIQASTYTGSASNNNPAWKTYQLSVDVAFLQHAVAKGLKIRLAASPLQDTFTACGLNPNDGSITAATAEACLDPMLAAAISYLSANGVAVYQILPWHEPTGYTPLVTSVTFSAANFTAMITAACVAVHAASGGSSVKCGGGFTSSDGSYVTNYTNNATADDTVLGLETYGGKTSTGYATAMATLVALCPLGIAASMTCENTEGDPPRHVPSTAPGGSEQYAYEGCAWDTGIAGWQTYGLNNAWAVLMPRYLAAYGFSSVTRYSTEPFGQFDPNPAQNCFDNSPSGATAFVIENTAGATAAQNGWSAGGTWAAGSWQGFGIFTGAAIAQ